MKEEMKELKCVLDNYQLVLKCRQWITDLCRSGGRSWVLQVPVNPEVDPDVLFTELIDRFEEKACAVTADTFVEEFLAMLTKWQAGEIKLYDKTFTEWQNQTK